MRLSLPSFLLEAYSLPSDLPPFYGEPVFELSHQAWQRIVAILSSWHTLGRGAFQEKGREFLVQEGFGALPDPLEPTAILNTFDFQGEGEDLSLIEVNTNGGGFLLGVLACALSDPSRAEEILARGRRVFLEMIAKERERLSAGAVWIVDEDPPREFLYPEMVTFARWIAEESGDEGDAQPLPVSNVRERLSSKEGRRNPPLLYNRFTDFYLTTPLGRSLRELWIEGAVKLSPSPIAYALQGDKRLFLVAGSQGIPGVAETLTLREWQERYDPSRRKEWVFKPISGFGSKGVYLGRKLSLEHYRTLDPDRYLVQRYIPPLTLNHPRYGRIKGDLRIFTYRGVPLLTSFRGFRGQVMGFREEGSGFYPVAVGNTLVTPGETIS